MQELKERTIKDSNIVQTEDGYYRYVNHPDKLATTGFRRAEMLIYYSGCFRFDTETVAIMIQRYIDLFGVS